MPPFLDTLLSLLSLPPTTGARGERAAARHLKRQGYRILARNLRNRFGEIDILAEAPDGRTVVVVEVKAGVVADSGGSGGSEGSGGGGAGGTTIRPEVHVDGRKRRKLVALAGQVARRYRLADRPIRFDVIGVDLPSRGKPVIRHHAGAFEAGN